MHVALCAHDSHRHVTERCLFVRSTNKIRRGKFLNLWVFGVSFSYIGIFLTFRGMVSEIFVENLCMLWRIALVVCALVWCIVCWVNSWLTDEPCIAIYIIITQTHLLTYSSALHMLCYTFCVMHSRSSSDFNYSENCIKSVQIQFSIRHFKSWP